MRVSSGARPMPSLRIGLVAAVLAALGLFGLVQSASAAFTAPVDVSGSLASDPQVATDADGDSVIVWDRPTFTNGPQARTLSAAGTPGPIFDLALASGGQTDHSPRLAIDARGDTIFAWSRTTGSPTVVARMMKADGTLGPTFFVSQAGGGTGLGSIDVASDRTGDSVITWVNNSTNRVQARVVSARGAVGPIRNVSGLRGRAPQVATDAGGDSVLTWVLEDGVDGDNDVIQARTMSVNGTLGPAFNLSAASGRATGPQVATDVDGDTTFTWLRTDGERDRAQTRTRSADGVLTAVVNLSAAGRSAQDPQVATDATGDSVFAWEIFDGLDDRVQVRTLSSAGALGPLTSISAPGGEAFAQQVDSSSTGLSTFTWLRFDGTNDIVQARRISPAGAVGGTFTLAAVGVDAQTPQVAVASDTATAAVVWERGGIIQVSTGP